MRSRSCWAVLHLADHRPAIGEDHGGRVMLERVAERVVGGDEEPTGAAGPRQRLRRPVRERPCVIGPMHGVGRAFGAGQLHRAGPDPMNTAWDPRVTSATASATGGERHVEDGVHAFLIDPAAGDGAADIGLVLVIGEDDLDGDRRVGAREILRGELAAATEPGPVESATYPLMSVSTPNVTVPGASAARPGPARPSSRPAEIIVMVQFRRFIVSSLIDRRSW